MFVIFLKSWPILHNPSTSMKYCKPIPFHNFSINLQQQKYQNEMSKIQVHMKVYKSKLQKWWILKYLYHINNDRSFKCIVGLVAKMSVEMLLSNMIFNRTFIKEKNRLHEHGWKMFHMCNLVHQFYCSMCERNKHHLQSWQ